MMKLVACGFKTNERNTGYKLLASVATGGWRERQNSEFRQICG